MKTTVNGRFLRLPGGDIVNLDRIVWVTGKESEISGYECTLYLDTDTFFVADRGIHFLHEDARYLHQWFQAHAMHCPESDESVRGACLFVGTHPEDDEEETKDGEANTTQGVQ